MDRRCLHVLVRRQRVDVGASVEQEPRRLDVPEETREPEGMKAVFAELVRAGGILVEQLLETVGPAESRGLEDI
jgi:hypothetical protein